MNPSMSFGQLFFSFNGRINRQIFWFYVVAQGVAYLLGSWFVVDGSIADWTIYLGLSYISFAIGCKRLHDFDKSGWWLLLYAPAMPTCMPVIEDMFSGLLYWILNIGGIGLFIACGFCKGTKGANRFGEQP